MKQQNLFGKPTPVDEQPMYPVSAGVDVTRSRHRGNKRSEEANRFIAPSKNNQRLRVYRWFVANAPAITEDCTSGLALRTQSVTARVSELKRDGFLEVCGQAATSSGARADLLRPTAKSYPGA